MHPCPCGYLTDRNRRCQCPPTAVRRYINKISGPLIDRIDIHLEVPAVRTADLMSAPPTETSENIRQRVEQSRAIQVRRVKEDGIFCNAQMTPSHIKKHCRLDEACQGMLRDAIEALGLSARAHDKILKVARTISDLAGSEGIRAEHLAEAISYRCLDKNNI